MATSERQLLPAAVRPVHYQLKFTPQLDPPLAELLTVPAGDGDADAAATGRVRGADSYTFAGEGSITVEVAAPTQQIVLHAAEMKVEWARLRGPGEVEVPVLTTDMDDKEETVTLRLAAQIQPGEYSVVLAWSAELGSKMLGFYKSAYKHPDEPEKTRYMAATQFEPTDARRAFPCFDEPAQKATFSVSLVAAPHRVCLSNMPVVEEKPEGDTGLRVVTFETTPIMSTYLLAFIVGELDFIEARTSQNNTLVRVYTLPGSTHLGQFALDVATKTLDFFTTFFGCPYPLPKCDLIAVPDFAAGAMENWGCITFRETALLLDPANSSASAKSRVAEVVAHELAHQWFGNLVTMEWWTHLWLNEGFATWAADLAVDTLFPKWQTWMQFVCSTFSAALRLDALQSSHPIEVEIARSHQVNEIFDAISYCKGASAIRMLVEFLGLETFQKGLRYYFTQHPYKNTATEDLWAALETAADKIKVGDIMGKWTQQVGYPLLQVQKQADGTFTVSQERFLSDGTTDSSGTSWIVPISFVSAREPTQSANFLLEDKQATLPAELTQGASWLKLNAAQAGIYRVLYPEEMYAALREPIQTAQLGSTDRLGVLMDAMALARAGRLKTTQALELLAGYSNETEYTCLVDVVGSVREVAGIFGKGGEDTIDKGLSKFGCQLLEKVGTSLGWDPKEGEEHVTSLARTLVLGGLVEFGHEATINEAKARFTKYLADASSLPADLRLPTYQAVVKSGGRDEYDAIVKLYNEAALNEEKIRLIQALGKTKSVELLQETLAWGLKEVKPQDLFYVVMTVSGNPKGRDLAWDFVKSNWQAFQTKYGRGNFLLTRFIEVSTRPFCSEERAADVEGFFDGQDKEGIERTLMQCLEGIRVRSAWRSRDGEGVEQWFAAK